MSTTMGVQQSMWEKLVHARVPYTCLPACLHACFAELCLLRALCSIAYRYTSYPYLMPYPCMLACLPTPGAIRHGYVSRRNGLAKEGPSLRRGSRRRVRRGGGRAAEGGDAQRVREELSQKILAAATTRTYPYDTYRPAFFS